MKFNIEIGPDLSTIVESKPTKDIKERQILCYEGHNIISLIILLTLPRVRWLVEVKI